MDIIVGDKNFLFMQFVVGLVLIMCWESDGVINNSLFSCFIGMVFKVRSAVIMINLCIYIVFSD